MEISQVKQRLTETIERAKRAAAFRRARNDEASRAYQPFLEQVAIPLFRQVANVLKAAGYPFAVFTPGGSVRLMSERNAEDFIEVSLETTGDRPEVIGHTSRARGRRVIEAERPVSDLPIDEITSEALLAFLSKELEPFVER
jgi:hypothetical protein